MEKLKPVLKFLRNKYALILIGSFIWMMFFDRNDIPSHWILASKINKLEADRDFYLKENERIKARKQVLFTDLGELERFAREKYLMKKDDEDLFIIQD